MILDGAEQLVASSVGWVDSGAFEIRSLVTGQVAHYTASEFGYLRLSPIDGERFLVATHAAEQDEFLLSVRCFDRPESVLWSLRCTPGGSVFSGEPAAASGIRKHHLLTFKNGGRWEHRLLTILFNGTRAILGQLPWYNGEEFDLGYQGLVDVVGFPGTDLVIVSVQRSSTLIVHDPRAEIAVGRIELAGQHGNPKLTIIKDELWTVDYDTFVRVNLKTRQVECAVRVQPPAGSVMQFAGDLCVWADRQRAVIPRPYSGDIIVIDPVSGVLENTITMTHQPLTCIVTTDGRIVARDWKSGGWLDGSIPAGQ